MYSIAIASLFGLAASTSAQPASQELTKSSSSSYQASSYVSNVGGAAQTPFSFPLANGFPMLSNDSLKQVQIAAQGTLPTGPLPSNVTANSLTALGAAAFGEIFEVAYFTSLIQNITNGVPGYQTGDAGFQKFVLRTLNAVQAQEELHAVGLNAILKANKAQPIQPCKYVFPVDNFDDAINLASTFTDVVLGTLQDIQEGLGINRDTELIRLIGSVIGQEGEQNGWYRSIENKIPSALPFLTTSAGPFAFSALNQIFVVNGSCPNINTINIPVFGALAVNPSTPPPMDSTLTLSFVNDGRYDGNYELLSLVYINQQNLPIVQPVQKVQVAGEKVTFEAAFPYMANLLNGLTIAAVTNSKGPFASADAVAAATLFGPGLIEVN